MESNKAGSVVIHPSFSNRISYKLNLDRFQVIDEILLNVNGRSVIAAYLYLGKSLVAKMNRVKSGPINFFDMGYMYTCSQSQLELVLKIAPSESSNIPSIIVKGHGQYDGTSFKETYLRRTQDKSINTMFIEQGKIGFCFDWGTMFEDEPLPNSDEETIRLMIVKGLKEITSHKCQDLKQKRELIYELWCFEKKGYPASKRYTTEDSIEEMTIEYELIKSAVEKVVQSQNRKLGDNNNNE